MKRKSLPITNIGTVSLMMVFIILCMVTLAALSLSSAARDARMGERLAEHLAEYYKASNEAEEMLAQADAACFYSYGRADGAADYYRQVESLLEGRGFTAARENGTFTIAYQTPVNDSQALSVLLEITSPGEMPADGGAFYKILSWRVINTDAWEGDDTLQLMQ